MSHAFLARLAAGLALFSTALGASAGQVVDIEVVHRATGRVAQAWHHEGRVHVAGAPGDRYAIRVTNRTGARVLAVISVDGVNVLSGETASPAQSGYVLGPWQSYDVTGWRKSSSEIAAFYFTSLGDSYAGRTGRPANVGVIGVAAFREMPAPRPQPVAPRARLHDEGAPATLDRPAEAERRAGPSAPSTTETPSAPAPSAPPATEAPGAREARDASETTRPLAPGGDIGRMQQRARIGTGHGERERSDVVTVTFRRASAVPDETIGIHYDAYANLVARGVIPVLSHPASIPEPFPGRRYVPDPPRG
jgi:hypothetical protein